MNLKDTILNLHTTRHQLLENSYAIEEKSDAKDQIDNQVTELGDQILKFLTENANELEFDFIMHQLSYLGLCPNLLNDDNGHWAVVSDGFQRVAFGDDPMDVQTQFIVEAIHWKDTPREALVYYLREE